MKKYIILSFIVWLVASFDSIGQVGKASFSFKTTKYDFGAIKEEEGVVSTSFEFINSGKGPLIIQRVVSSCDCAVVEWPKEPIIPGASGKVKVSFNPVGRIGKFEKLITVYSNAETSTVVLFINGLVRERQKTVDEIYNRVIGNFRFKTVHAALGQIFNNQTKVDTIEFIYTGSEPVKIGANLSNTPFLRVSFVPVLLKTNERGLLIIAYDANVKNDWGFLVDRFGLTQNEKDISGAMITVSATIEEDFDNLDDTQKAKAPKIDLPSENFDFGEVKEGDLVEKEFDFTNAGKSDLIIRKIKASCGCTTVEPADKVVKPGKSSSFKASVRTNGFSGRIAKTVNVITNDPVNPSITIRITGNVLPKYK